MSQGWDNNNDSGSETKKEEMIRIDGREQVLDMLRAADPEFREVLLRGLEKRDARLARELRREL
jgi:hypothetical protein